MPSFAKRYNAKNKKETIEMLENLINGIKSGRLVVTSKGYWKGVTTGKYLYRVDVDNVREMEELGKNQ